MATVTNYYTTTFTPSLIGNVGRVGVNETFSTIRAGAGNTTDTGDYQNIVLNSTSTTNQYATLYRNILLFDTSAIPTGAVISSASITLKGQFKSNGLGSPSLEVVSSNPASNASLANSDYSTLGSTSFASVSYATFSDSGINTISLNSSGLTNITKNGISKFGFRTSWDLNNSFTGSWSSGVSSQFAWYNATSQPYLTVSYTVDFPTLSVNNISSLSNVTTITTS